ncbi:hypothetical protein [Solwaraspora sp. WMMD792]|uniref:hypothetical protein n=1 Tax=Solwaraspora sp. WMMD792 TaxID=3016099 RepID=UPI002417DCE0|nr:hypothetical protein [Solwaraspora sp. WMMD792]MDG4771956.1 hypothetical protein [Solwaraspora sp. WMMD792]
MSPRVSFVLHAVGHADLGVPPPDSAGATDLLRLLDERPDDDDQTRRILRLRTPAQTTGDTAPLAAALAALHADPDTAGTAVHLILATTARVAAIAAAIDRAVRRLPDLYGGTIAAVTVMHGDSLDETDIATGVTRTLDTHADPGTDRAYVVWGSGSTQTVLGALDAVITSGLPWSLIRIGPTVAPRHAVYDPTAGLPVDPVVPLLRRWRYHDLLRVLADAGQLSLTVEQRRVVDAEADHFGQAYVVPNADRMRAVMAAALMRGDGSSGFTVRAYVAQRYHELRAADGSPLDLLTWAEQHAKRTPVTLGAMLRVIREQRAGHADPAVRAAKAAPSGRWLASQIVHQLNEMGKASAHELRPPDPLMLDALRRHLRQHDRTPTATATAGDGLGVPAAGDDAPAGLGPLTLVPGDTVWYLSVVGNPSRDGSPYIVEQIVQAAADPDRRDDLDPAVRTYLGLPAGQPVPVKALILGTAAGTYPHARQAADRLRAAGHTAVAAPIADLGVAADDPAAFTEPAAAELLRQHVGPDTGAIVLIPTGPKEHVLTLLAAGQQTAAVRGIPLFLRQLVTRDRSVLDAGTHRLPLRFGTDLAILAAASHALDVAELDTAARLLGTLATGQPLSARAVSLSDALRCATPRLRRWPVPVQAGVTTTEDCTFRMIGERIDVWAALPDVDRDAATGMRAIIGACASTEHSIDANRLKEATRRQVLRPLYEIRNRLPITHGHGRADGDTPEPLNPEPLNLEPLIVERTGGAQHTVSGLLTAMAAAARTTFGDRPGTGPRLADLLAELRADVRRLRDTEHTELAWRAERAGQAGRPGLPGLGGLGDNRLGTIIDTRPE